MCVKTDLDIFLSTFHHTVRLIISYATHSRVVFEHESKVYNARHSWFLSWGPANIKILEAVSTDNLILLCLLTFKKRLTRIINKRDEREIMMPNIKPSPPLKVSLLLDPCRTFDLICYQQYICSLNIYDDCGKYWGIEN